MKRLFAAALLLLAVCAGKHTDYAFKMDYPVDAARLSLGGDIHRLCHQGNEGYFRQQQWNIQPPC